MMKQPMSFLVVLPRLRSEADATLPPGNNQSRRASAQGPLRVNAREPNPTWSPFSLRTTVYCGAVSALLAVAGPAAAQDATPLASAPLSAIQPAATQPAAAPAVNDPAPAPPATDTPRPPPASETAAAPANLAPSTAATQPEYLRLALSPLSWEREPGQGVALAYEAGAWGLWLGQGLRVGIPLGRHMAVNLRGVFLMDIDEPEGESFTADLGGRLDVIGRSPVYLNIVRLYGGGGLQVFRPVFNTRDRGTSVGGGGHFGFEFFQSPYQSFFLEVGGQGGIPAPGVTILAGMAFYPWTK